MTRRPVFRRLAHELTDVDDSDTRRVDQREQVETLRRLALQLADERKAS
jgi:hypothetical protein